MFLDEGGNFDFSPTGTKFFTLTCVSMIRPFHMADPLDNLKYDLMELGLDIERFHATEDKQAVRNQVFSIIQRHIENLQIDALIVEKRKTIRSLQEESHFYLRMFEYLLRYPLTRPTVNDVDVNDLDEVIVITDKIPVQKKRKHVEKAIKLKLKDILPDVPSRIMHHSSKSSMELQIADYCNWAIFRKWEREDSRSYDLIKEGIKSEFDIFETGGNYYY